MITNRKSRISEIINKTYRNRYKLKSGDTITTSNLINLDRKFKPLTTIHTIGRRKVMLRSKTSFLIAILLIVAFAKASLSVYYYNKLVDTQQNMLAAHGDVQVLMQRRKDIANNLSKAVLDYSKHEQDVFTSIVSLRKLLTKDNYSSNDVLAKLKNLMESKKPGLPSPGAANPLQADLFSSLTKLVAVAEQYPDLKLAANFETLMAALVQVEQDLALQRIKFNKETNIYTTVMVKFPGNVFAWIFRFKPLEYYEADDHAKTFKLIGY